MTSLLLFSVTAGDCDFECSRGTGKGGQKRNKTSSKVRCVHRDSGAVGLSDDTRSQHQNKRIAFRRMAESPKFNAWLRLETARRLGRTQQAEDATDRAMQPKNLRVEEKRDGRWCEI
ncbi:MAG: peptide chain release factor family protein [Geminicoccaceae bacterium]